MKKIFLVAACAAFLGIVGCSSSDKTEVKAKETTVTQNHKAKCKHGKCHHHKGKMGVENTVEDTAK